MVVSCSANGLWINHSPFSRCIGDPTKFVLVARLNSYIHHLKVTLMCVSQIAFREQDIHNFFHRNFLFNLSRSAGMNFVHM